MEKPPPPFACTYSPQVPELLLQLKCTLAISTYQAGKVIFISAEDKDRLIQLPRNFEKPMGLAIQDNKLAIAGRYGVTVLANSPELAAHYPKQPGVYDGLYVPRSLFFTGELDLHDLEYVDSELLAVNTRFSCLAKITDNFSFEPVWQPPFIKKSIPEDQCHLNGMAIEDNQVKYVTSLGDNDKSQGWRDQKATGGLLMDVDSNEIILRKLPMPHSPRIIEKKILMLLSATGQLVSVDTNKGDYEVVREFPGFVRGMTPYNDYLFIGLSKLRKTSATFGDLPIAKKSPFCGVVIMHIPTMSVAGQIQYQSSVEEIYDIKVLPELQRPGLLSPSKIEHIYCLTTPSETYWASIEKKEE